MFLGYCGSPYVPGSKMFGFIICSGESATYHLKQPRKLKFDRKIPRPFYDRGIRFILLPPRWSGNR